MRFILSACLIVISLFMSCNNKTDNTPGAESQTKEPAKDSPTNCYRFANANDTIILKLIHVGEAITGTLVYKLHEKDKNIGTIQGHMRGDILVADYTFMSEGTKSVRQVAFKKVNNSFLEGYGEITSTNDKVSFKNIDSLQFNNSLKLTEVNCQ